jgi:uncharacterized membrane protein
MEILFILLASFVLLQLAGYLGIRRLTSRRNAGLGALAIMFLVTSSAHFNDLKYGLAAMMPEPLPDGLWIISLTGLFEIAGASGCSFLRPAGSRASAWCCSWSRSSRPT